MQDNVPGFLFLDHVAIAVKQGELAAQIERYESMGFRVLHREDVLGTDQVREVILANSAEERDLIQLLEPLDESSPVARQIEKAGGRGGLAHIAWRVANIDTAFAYFVERGIPVLDAAPRPGSRGTTVFFVHPKAFGYLLEIVSTNP